MSPVQGPDGSLYGTTVYGGASSCDDAYGFGCGVVYKVTSRGVLTVLYNFSDSNLSDGIFPGPLVLATDGNFYGTASWGGTNNANQCYDDCGTVFTIAPEGKLTTLYSFCSLVNCVDGANPVGLVQATDGEFYGITWQGGTGIGSCSGYRSVGCGTVFKITRAGTLTTLYSFCSQTNCSDGAKPVGLVQATDGKFYGTTYGGGSPSCYQGCGTVFKITSEGELTTLHTFCTQSTLGCPDGVQPSGLIQALDGYLYGTAGAGGATGDGTVFRISLAGTLKTLHSFCALPSCSDGREPVGGVMQATDGNFYGTTPFGGNGENGNGTIFRITPQGVLTTLHTFTNGGANPFSPPTQGTNGTLYGTTTDDFVGGDGGACPPYGCGTVYSLDMGLGPFVTFVRAAGKVGQTGPILGQGLTGTTRVLLNGTPASFTVASDTYIRGTVPPGATTGYVTVTTPGGTLTSNVPFHVIR